MLQSLADILGASRDVEAASTVIGSSKFGDPYRREFLEKGLHMAKMGPRTPRDLGRAPHWRRWQDKSFSMSLARLAAGHTGLGDGPARRLGN